MLPRDYIRQGTEGGPPAPSRGGSREARLCPSASSSSAQGILPGREGGDRTPREQVGSEEERPASGLPDTAPVRSALQVEARGVWDRNWGNSELGEGGCLPGILAPSWVSLLCHPPSEREAVGRQA